MGSIEDWMRDHKPDGSPRPSGDITLVAVIAWIAAIVVAANLLFLAQRLMG